MVHICFPNQKTEQSTGVNLGPPHTVAQVSLSVVFFPIRALLLHIDAGKEQDDSRSGLKILHAYFWLTEMLIQWYEIKWFQ